MKSNRITIRDVAREAGVSTAAVSQAFNSNGRLSDQTRERVLSVARHLKYHPNRHARNLAAKSTRTLGIVVSDIENPFFAVVMKSFEARARHYGFETIASETGYELPLMRRAAERIMEQDVSGVAIFTSEMSHAWLEEIVCRDIPVACFDLDFLSERVSNVKVNYTSGMRQLTQHLYDLGHRRIAYAGGRSSLKNIQFRHEAYLNSMQALGLDAGPVFTGNQRLDGGYAVGSSIMQLSPRPTAVVAVNDLTAVGLINAFCEAGLRVPADISVAGFDNTFLAAYFVPRLTTVDMHPDLLGATAADALHDSITAANHAGSEYAIKIDLVVGKSTGPVPSA